VYDADNERRLKTVELIIESVPWQPRPRNPRRRDDEIIAVRIAWHETDLRERAKRLGAIWRPAQKLWEMRWADARRLGLCDRAAAPGSTIHPQTSAGISRDLPALSCIYL
jgi:hypothetical protein